MIKAIFFDFGGVIVTHGFKIWIDKNVPDSKIHWPHIRELGKKVDSGKMSGDEYTNYLAKVSGKPFDVVEREIFSEYFINEDVLDIIKKLHSKVKLILVTNFPKN